MPFQVNIKLGRPIQELSFDATVDGLEMIGIRHNQTSSKNENIVGELFLRVRRRNNPKYVLKISSASETLTEQLESLRNISDTHLSFVWANARNMFSDRYTTDSTLALTLASNPMTGLGKIYKDLGGLDTDIITIQGVFTTYSASGAQGGTNFFTSGNYAASTRIITLGSSPGAAGTVVFVNWRFNGSLVNLTGFSVDHAGGNFDGAPRYDISIELEGA